MEHFVVRDCALSAIATGQKAQNLKELRYNLLSVDPACVYYHFWGGLLRPRFDDPEFNNDFASWVKHSLHDTVLAERLGVIDPTDFADLEALREELIGVIEERLDESEVVTWAKADDQFHFIRSKIVVFRTGLVIKRPADLAEVLPHLSVSSVFYHAIDARRRNDDGRDDFYHWLCGGVDRRFDDLGDMLAGVEPFFRPLSDLRATLSRLFRTYFSEVA
jgi:hypothetical protein